MKYDPDAVANVDLKAKFRIEELFNNVTYNYVNGKPMRMYMYLNDLYMRLESILDEYKQPAEKCLKDAKDILKRHQYKEINELPPNKHAEFVGILMALNKYLHRACIKNKFWFKKVISEEERFMGDDVEENTEEDTGKNVGDAWPKPQIEEDSDGSV